MVAYQTAYLKANYPSEYMAAVMSRSLSNITDITKLMDECKAMGIQTLGPDVNESNLKFTVNHDGNIRFGLGAVKGVGEAAVQSIVEERNTNGPFKGIFDFVQRVNLNACNKKNMECLALAGGFDSFPELKREQYFAVNSKGEVFLETLMRYGNRYQEDKRAAINSLFGGANVVDIATPEIPQGVERWGDLERLNKERDLVGIYLSAHPLDEFAIVLDHVCNTRMADLEDKAALAGREITIGWHCDQCPSWSQQEWQSVCIAKIEDYSGSTEIPFWGNDWVTYQGYLNEARSCISKPVVSQAMAAGRTGSQDHFNGTSARRERRTGAEDHHYHSSVSVKFGTYYRAGHFDQRTSRQYGTLLQGDG